MTSARSSKVDAATIAGFRGGDHRAFARISQHHFRELHVHCYRMVGSFDEAEDLVQETLLRAWRGRDSYEGRASIRTWLYRIATNLCMDRIRARPSHEAPSEAEPSEPHDLPRYARFPWIQPYPDSLLDDLGDDADTPDSRMVTRETMELAFLAALQLLPSKQRAVLILRDVLDFSGAETAGLLDDTLTAVDSALRRARATLHDRRGPVRPQRETGFAEAVLLQAFIDAQERGDVHAMIALLRDDVRMTLLPDAVTWDGRDAVACELSKKRIEFEGDVRSIAIAANRQPAMAVYLRRSGEAAYQPWAIVLLGVLDGELREIATFASPELFERFHLPPTLPERRPAAP